MSSKEKERTRQCQSRIVFSSSRKIQKVVRAKGMLQIGFKCKHGKTHTLIKTYVVLAESTSFASGLSLIPLIIPICDSNSLANTRKLGIYDVSNVDVKARYVIQPKSA